MVFSGDSSCSRVPDLLVIARLGPRPGVEDDAVQDQLPQQALILDHARIGQELPQIDPHAPGVGGVGRAEIDQEHADMRQLRCGCCLHALDGDGARHVCGFARLTILVKSGTLSIVSRPTMRGERDMTVAEYCIFGAVTLYLLTIAPFNGGGLHEASTTPNRAIRPSMRMRSAPARSARTRTASSPFRSLLPPFCLPNSGLRRRT